MKQVLQNLRKGKTEVADVPVPTPRPKTALVRTAASLVSAGTERMVVEFAEKSLAGKARSRPDLVKQVVDKARREGLLTTVEAALNRLDQPMALGYSSAGTIVEVGDGLEGFKAGQRVACAGGGYAVHAEYVVVPQNLLAALPDEVGFEAAAFTTLGAIALHGFRLADVQVGGRVAVVGLGLLGLLAAGIARAAGCEVLGIDLELARVRLAEEMGAQGVLREGAEETAQVFSRGRGCDAVLICADSDSNDPVELAGRIARDRANIVAVGAVGMEIPRRDYFGKELNFIVSRSYGPGRYDPGYEEGGRDYPIGYVRWTEGRNLEAFVDLLASGRLDVTSLISHRFPIEEASEAYALISGKRKEPFMGVLLTYPQDEEDLRAAKIVGRVEAGKPAADGKVTLGVLGAGNFASAVLLPAIKKLRSVERVGVASASGLNAQHARRKFGFAYATSDEETLIGDESINTLAVLTRHDLHARQVVAGLKAGKHVFCEKPLALNREELGEIAKAVEGADTLLMVGFNRRFAPLAIEMKAFLDKRGEPFAAHYRVNAGYLPPGHWLHDPGQGGGRIIGEACHFVDFLTYLAGEAPVTVSAKGLPDGGRYQEDNAVLTFTFPDGSLGTISYLANGDKAVSKEYVEVFAGGRVAILDEFRRLETSYKGKRKTRRSRLRQDKGHRGEWRAFIQAVIGGGAPLIPYDDLFGVTRATFAAVEALRSGETLKVQ
jgi:predicted dehydrogenase